MILSFFLISCVNVQNKGQDEEPYSQNISIGESLVIEARNGLRKKQRCDEARLLSKVDKALKKKAKKEVLEVDKLLDGVERKLNQISSDCRKKQIEKWRAYFIKNQPKSQIPSASNSTMSQGKSNSERLGYSHGTSSVKTVWGSIDRDCTQKNVLIEIINESQQQIKRDAKAGKYGSVKVKAFLKGYKAGLKKEMDYINKICS